MTDGRFHDCGDPSVAVADGAALVSTRFVPFRDDFPAPVAALERSDNVASHMKARSSFPWPAFGILGAFLLVAGNGLAAPPTAAIAYRLDEGADHARCGKECWPHFNGFIEKTLANMRQR